MFWSHLISELASYLIKENEMETMCTTFHYSAITISAYSSKSKLFSNTGTNKMSRISRFNHSLFSPEELFHWKLYINFCCFLFFCMFPSFTTSQMLLLTLHINLYLLTTGIMVHSMNFVLKSVYEAITMITISFMLHKVYNHSMQNRM